MRYIIQYLVCHLVAYLIFFKLNLPLLSGARCLSHRIVLQCNVANYVIPLAPWD